jgi:glycosyltransferase involved in cell wall biosynthesis
MLKASGVDLLFCPHFNVPLLCPVPFVVTIHDLILHRYPNQASALRRLAYRAVMRHAVGSSRAIIAVSAFTESEVKRFFGKGAANKTRVIRQAVSGEFHRKSASSCSAVLQKYALKKPFFLYVGNAKEHKNVQMLIDAYASLGNTDTELVLVTGGAEASRLMLRDGVRILSDIADHDLPCLYFFAACFVTASLYEGFGLPVWEAAACGCPVIVTNRGALPEIAAEGSRIVEPMVEELAEAMRDPPSPIETGGVRTWEQVAEQTALVLND